MPLVLERLLTLPGITHSPILIHELKPLLKWAGGKRWLVKHLKPIWLKHNHRRLVEPFCGGLAISLGLIPQKALLNDVNPHLINFYKWVKKGIQIRIEMKNDKDVYYKYRKQFNELIKDGQQDTAEAAQIFYYLNRTGYNGLCRFNSDGEFNVPFGKYENINYEKNLKPYENNFKNWEFISVDFEKILLESNDFIYADPPYDVEFTQYSKNGFNWKDQIRLVKWLAKHRGPIVLSNQATNRIIKIYKQHGFELKYFDAPRMISCDGNRTPAKEVFAVKNISL